ADPAGRAGVRRAALPVGERLPVPGAGGAHLPGQHRSGPDAAEVPDRGGPRLAAAADRGGVLFRQVRRAVASRQRVVVEFFGVPRARAGRAELAVEAGTVAEALAAVEIACPGLKGLVRAGRLAPHYLLSVNGTEFVGDMQHALRCEDRLLL